MPGYFDEEDLNALNNLGGGWPAPPAPQMGDVLNTLNVGDPSTINAGITVIEVRDPSEGGSDTEGDGSAAAPFATLQKAWDYLVARASPGYFQIQIGAGTFTAPILNDRRPKPGVYAVFVGNRDTDPANTIPVPNTFSTVAGRSARQRANVGAYGITVNQGTHWLELDYGIGVFFPPWACPIADSSSPNIDSVEPPFGYTANMVARPYETFIDIPADPLSVARSLLGPSPRVGDTIAFVGCSFTTTSISNILVQSIAFLGCNFAAANFCNWYFDNCIFNSAFSQGGSINAYFVNGSTVAASVFGSSTGSTANMIFRNDYSLDGEQTVVNTIFLGNATFTVADNSFARSFVNIDWDGAGARCLLVSPKAGLELFFVTGRGQYVDAARTTYMTVDNGFVECSVGAQNITGSVTGNAVTLTNGAQVVGIENAASGTLTAGGSEIVVGDNAGATFASLPATDLAAAAPELCRAT